MLYSVLSIWTSINPYEQVYLGKNALKLIKTQNLANDFHNKTFKRLQIKLDRLSAYTGIRWHRFRTYWMRSDISIRRLLAQSWRETNAAFVRARSYELFMQRERVMRPCFDGTIHEWILTLISVILVGEIIHLGLLTTHLECVIYIDDNINP